MDDMPMKKMIETALENIRKVADVNTVIGQPIELPDEITVIPFSKVSVGFASGGSDLDAKQPSSSPKFAGGNGAGLTVIPLGFIVVNHGDVRVVDLAAPNSLYQAPANDPVSKTIDMLNGVLDRAPGLIDRIREIVVEAVSKAKKKKEKEEDIEARTEL